MLNDFSLKQVWCENQDDITLIWESRVNGERAEFVQVKGEEPDQLWSVAMLCGRKTSAQRPVPGTSVLERSLAYDRCSEPCSFRVVTSRGVNSDLEPLTWPLGSPSRKRHPELLEAVAAKCEEKVGDFRSSNDNDCGFWVGNACWETVHDIEAMANRNRIRLRSCLESAGVVLLSDQLEDLYEQILTKVQQAALSPWHPDPEAKKILSAPFEQWIHTRVARLTTPPDQGGRSARRKMEAARIADDQIEDANEQRIAYRTDALSSRYLDLEDRRFVEREASALLHDLRSQLDSGYIADNGVAFHRRCLRSLNEFSDSLPSARRPPRHHLYGFMYYATDRCRHRFVPSRP